MVELVLVFLRSPDWAFSFKEIFSPGSVLAVLFLHYFGCVTNFIVIWSCLLICLAFLTECLAWDTDEPKIHFCKGKTRKNLNIKLTLCPLASCLPPSVHCASVLCANQPYLPYPNDRTTCSSHHSALQMCDWTFDKNNDDFAVSWNDWPNISSYKVNDCDSITVDPGREAKRDSTLYHNRQVRHVAQRLWLLLQGTSPVITHQVAEQ